MKVLVHGRMNIWFSAHQWRNAATFQKAGKKVRTAAMARKQKATRMDCMSTSMPTSSTFIFSMLTSSMPTSSMRTSSMLTSSMPTSSLQLRTSHSSCTRHKTGVSIDVPTWTNVCDIRTWGVCTCGIRAKLWKYICTLSIKYKVLIANSSINDNITLIL